MDPKYTYLPMLKLTSSLRFLGFPRVVSMESFRKPNFELVSEIIQWLCKKFEPAVEINLPADSEGSRASFMKQAISLLASKSRVEISVRELYYSDYRCINELLKLVLILYNACSKKEILKGDFSLPPRFDKKRTRELAKEITELGRTIYEQLDEEKDNKEAREQSLSSLTEIQKEGNSEIGKNVKALLKNLEENIENTNNYINSLSEKEQLFIEKISNLETEIDRGERKIKTIGNIRPAYIEEMERYEKELERVFQIYLEKARNLDYLEAKFEEYNEIEKKKHANMLNYLKKMQETIKNKEETVFDENLTNINKGFNKYDINDRINEEDDEYD